MLFEEDNTAQPPSSQHRGFQNELRDSAKTGGFNYGQMIDEPFARTWLPSVWMPPVQPPKPFVVNAAAVPRAAPRDCRHRTSRFALGVRGECNGVTRPHAYDMPPLLECEPTYELEQKANVVIENMPAALLSSLHYSSADVMPPTQHTADTAVQLTRCAADACEQPVKNPLLSSNMHEERISTTLSEVAPVALPRREQTDDAPQQQRVMKVEFRDTALRRAADDSDDQSLKDTRQLYYDGRMVGEEGLADFSDINQQDTRGSMFSLPDGVANADVPVQEASTVMPPTANGNDSLRTKHDGEENSETHRAVAPSMTYALGIAAGDDQTQHDAGDSSIAVQHAANEWSAECTAMHVQKLAPAIVQQDAPMSVPKAASERDACANARDNACMEPAITRLQRVTRSGRIRHAMCGAVRRAVKAMRACGACFGTVTLG